MQWVTSLFWRTYRSMLSTDKGAGRGTDRGNNRNTDKNTFVGTDILDKVSLLLSCYDLMTEKRSSSNNPLDITIMSQEMERMYTAIERVYLYLYT